jgi:oligoribonuclease NrnB/cAMP/cGMP phosphodiesterase (DHH superfamily)
MIIIYHSRDLDGYASGAILKKKFPQAQLIGYDYGQPLPDLPPNEDIIMADVSFKMDDLMRLALASKSFVWIDHHISAINDYHKQETAPGQLRTVLQDGIAACELCWQWAFPDKEMPYAITLLGMYDTWRNTDPRLWDEEIMPFQYGARVVCTSPETFPPSFFDSSDLTEVTDHIHLGKVILDYQGAQDARAAKGAFEFEWKGHKVIAINSGGFSSNAFKSVYDPYKHDIMMPFVFNGILWKFSLYTTKEDIDCSALAKEMGGGGHRKAAGFEMKSVNEPDFPFWL